MLKTLEVIVYEDGKIQFIEEVKLNKPIEVLVTFLNNVDSPEVNHKKIDFNIFSFNKTKEILKKYKLNLSQTIIDDRIQ